MVEKAFGTIRANEMIEMNGFGGPHTHSIPDVALLAEALADKSDAGHNHDGMYADALHNHNGVYAQISHTHGQGDVSGLTQALALKSDVGHTHPGSGGVQMLRKAADQPFTAIAYANVTDLSIPVSPNTDYAFEFCIVWSSAATTTGVAFGLNGPASPVMFFATVETATTATAFATRQDVAYDQGAASASIDAANVNRLCRIKGVLRTGANGGALTVRCKTEIANSAITVKRGSWGTWF